MGNAAGSRFMADGGLFRVVGLRVVVAFDGELCSIVIVFGGFRVVGLRMVAALDGSLVSGLFSDIVWTSVMQVTSSGKEGRNRIAGRKVGAVRLIGC